MKKTLIVFLALFAAHTAGNCGNPLTRIEKTDIENQFSQFYNNAEWPGNLSFVESIYPIFLN